MMLGLKKEAIKVSGGGVKTYSFHTFGIKKRGAYVLEGRDALNCNCKDGRLKGGIGVKAYADSSGDKIPVSITQENASVFVTTSNTDASPTPKRQVYLVDQNGYLYWRNPSTNKAEQKLFLGPGVDHCVLKTESGRIYNIFVGTADIAITKDGTSFTSQLLDGLRGGCIAGKRLITARYNGEIRYSKVFEPFAASSSDPDGSGIIYMPPGYGEVVGIKEYGGEVYVFCERGIFRMAVFAKASDFTLKNIPYNGGNICLRSMVVSGKGIVFLASDGAYCVNGDSVKRICEHLPIGPCDVHQLCATGYGNGFVMIDYARKMQTGAEGKRIVIDTDCEDGFFANAYGALGGNEYTHGLSEVCIFTQDDVNVRRGQTPYFTSVPLDFGTKKNKRLKTLRLQGDGQITVTIRCGDVEQSYSLSFIDGVAQTRLTGKGKAVTLTFQLHPWAVVEDVEIDYIVEK